MQFLLAKLLHPLPAEQEEQIGLALRATAFVQNCLTLWEESWKSGTKVMVNFAQLQTDWLSTVSIPGMNSILDVSH